MADTKVRIDYMEYANDAAAQAAWVTNSTASNPTGGTITTVGSNYLHTFNIGGTFTVPTGATAASASYLVVAGGGGGAASNPSTGNTGGGGGGAVLAGTDLLNAGAFAITVGTGGIGGGYRAEGSKGGDSTFNSHTAGGGGGGTCTTGANHDGGCGAGGSSASTAAGAGNPGKDGAAGSGANGGGGGGMGVAGSTINGGDGITSTITGSSLYYGGGGASSVNVGSGGTGGQGGGANGAASGQVGNPGTDGRGGGGSCGANGGGGVDSNGGKGGTGVVFVSYATGSLASSIALQCYAESTIITQGTYSMKIIANATTSLNKTLTRTISPTINLTDVDTLKFDMRASRTGSNTVVTLYDSGGATTSATQNIASANTWETQSWDISGVATANKDGINSIVIGIINADDTNTIYIDNFFEAFPAGGAAGGGAYTWAC